LNLIFTSSCCHSPPWNGFSQQFGFSIIPSKQQGLQAASGYTFSKASTSSFINPWSSYTITVVAVLTRQVQQLLQEFPTLLRSSAATFKPLHGNVHHINTGSVALVLACPRRQDPEKHHIAEEEFLQIKQAGIIRAQSLPSDSHRRGGHSQNSDCHPASGNFS
jgi:hypothetical protein